MLGIEIRREGEVRHVVAQRLHDLTVLLACPGRRDTAFPLANGWGDEARSGGSGPSPRGKPPRSVKARDMFVPDLRIDRRRPRMQSFRLLTQRPGTPHRPPILGPICQRVPRMSLVLYKSEPPPSSLLPCATILASRPATAAAASAPPRLAPSSRSRSPPRSSGSRGWPLDGARRPSRGWISEAGSDLTPTADLLP